jgi:hypothetical protein
MSTVMGCGGWPGRAHQAASHHCCDQPTDPVGAAACAGSAKAIAAASAAAENHTAVPVPSRFIKDPQRVQHARPGFGAPI